MSKKKAAILLFGMYREFVEMRDKSKIVEEFYDCDYYMSTWSKSKQKYINCDEYKEIDVTPDKITNYLPDCIFEILNQEEIFPTTPVSLNANYIYFHWQNVYRLMEETGKEYDIVFLIRPDNDISLNYESKDKVLKWVENHEDVLYGPSFMKILSFNPFSYFTEDAFLLASPKIIGNIIKTLPDMRDVNFTFNGHYNSHKFLSDHLINLGYAPTDTTPFRSWFHRPCKDNWLEKLI